MLNPIDEFKSPILHLLPRQKIDENGKIIYSRGNLHYSHVVWWPISVGGLDFEYAHSPCQYNGNNIHHQEC